MGARFFASILGGTVAVIVAISCLPDLELAGTQNGSCGNGVVDLDKGEACDPGDGGATGCTSTCQVDCDGGAIDPKSSHCYFWIENVVAIDDAINGCNVAGGHLVSFVDLEELTAVVANSKKLIGAPDGGATWLALEKTGDTNDAGLTTYYFPPLGEVFPGWSASCPGCFALADGGDADLPLGGTLPQDCVNWRRTTGASFTQGVCTLTTAGPVLCEREPSGAFSESCDDASTDLCIEVPWTAGQKKYVFVSQGKTFDLATADCVARGGMLAHFESSAEREEVIRELPITGGNVWIGLAFDSEAGAWSWLDGTPASTVPLWADGEPSMNGTSAVIEIDRSRFDTRLAQAADPTNTFQYICQLPK